MTPFTAERWRQLSPHLDRLLGTCGAERGAALAALRRADPGLAAELESLLLEHEALEREGFLAADAPLEARPTTLAGLRVGAYVLREPLGQGGMGSVWLADRADGRFRGVAAVKLLNASLVGREGEARFRREGDFLARLRHPHIALLIDAGVSPGGQPYLVLEHVDGERIDHSCDAAGLGVDERVRLFLDVLGAVAFAHARLVVHRDLKPANVLVDREGRVKLLDFGIAKLIDPDAGELAVTALTREGQPALTPQYAAPEQLTGGAITTATDVYALGVLLYELLTGRHPSGPATTSPAEWIRAVVERPPPRASAAVSGAEEAAMRRGTTPRRLARALAGDLDNIVAKALAKRPAERYPSVESLAEDLRRYLAQEPVSARGDSLAYRVVKFVRRRRLGVAAAGLVLAVILAGSAGVAWQAREASAQRDAARTQLARATAANEFTTFLLSVGAPGGGTFTVGELLEQGEDLIDKQFAGDDPMRAEMLATVGLQYLLSERWDKATPVLERAAEIAGRTGDPTLRARASCPLALLKILNGDRTGAEALMQRTLAELPDSAQQAVQRAECLTRFAEFGFVTGEAAPMIARAEAALAALDRAPASSATKRIDARSALAYGYYLAHRHREADRAYAEIMTALAANGRDRTLVAADTLNNWGLVHFHGDIRRAEPLFRRVVELRRSIEGGDGIAPTFTFNLAGVLHQLGRYSEAGALLAETIRTAEARGERRVLFDAMMELSEVELDAGDARRAAAQLARLEPHLTDPRFNALRRAQHAYYRARLAQARGDDAGARALFGEAVALFDASPQKLPLHVQALVGLARTEAGLGQAQGAREAAERALALAESFVEQGSPSYLVGRAWEAFGDAWAAGGEAPAARDCFRRALEQLETTLGPGHREARRCREKLAV
ncbi:MAG: serine/threonine protein kinase [Acidobacteria bacterium]|nr:serine/threonine protein kinase [Acidobacteriota bacterium]